MNTTKYIFDLDGTLYDIDGQPGTKFGDSAFCADLIADTQNYIAQALTIDPVEAMAVLKKVQLDYDGEISIGLERSYGIDRYDLFDQTWGREVARYIIPNSELRGQLEPFVGRAALLSAAPRVWVSRVLDFLGVTDVFEDRIFSGEPDLRKPNPQVFALVARTLGVQPEQCVSIGDQNHSDILPAKSLGMRTALVGPEQLDADVYAPSLTTLIPQLLERSTI